VNTTNNDPWQSVPATSTTQANPWGGNNHTTTNNGNGLSVNISDPWGVGTTDSQTTTTTSPPTNTKSVDNELNEFFGSGAGKIY
jgi:hypothetical protein